MWLADIMLATGWIPTPLDALDLDERYPGLIDDLALLLNVHHAIREQFKQDDKD
jgi:hypothetical protein